MTGNANNNSLCHIDLTQEVFTSDDSQCTNDEGTDLATISNNDLFEIKALTSCPSLCEQSMPTEYFLTPREVLSLAMEGMAYNDIPETVSNRKVYLGLLHKAQRQSLHFRAKNNRLKPVSGLDFFVLSSFELYPKFQYQAREMWSIIKRRYKLKFHLNYLVHCSVYRLFKHGVRPNWKQVLCNQGPCKQTRLQVTKYCINVASYHYEKTGLFVPLNIEDVKKLDIKKLVLNFLKSKENENKVSSSTCRDCTRWASTVSEITSRSSTENNVQCIHDLIKDILYATNSNVHYVYCISINDKQCNQYPTPLADHCHAPNTVVYVGQTKNLRQRLHSHQNKNTMPSKLKEYLKPTKDQHNTEKAWADTFTVHILDVAANKQDADDKEAYFIDLFNTVTNGANVLTSAPGHSNAYWSMYRQRIKRSRQH